MVHFAQMTKPLQKARAAQFGFFAAGAVMLTSIVLGWSLVVTVAALLVCSVFRYSSHAASPPGRALIWVTTPP